MSAHPPESGIPVLTEILATPVYGVDLPERRLTPPAVPQQDAPGGSVALDAAQRERIERSVQEAVLRNVLGRLDMLLEERIRDSLTAVLQTAVTALADELKQGLEHVLTPVLAQAVAQELEQHRLSEK